jgi:hypothetical protein
MMDDGRQSVAEQAISSPQSPLSKTQSPDPGPQSPATPPHPLAPLVRYWYEDLAQFSRALLERPLRPYQLEPARAIVDSVVQGRGRTFAIMMARQSGKNELSGQIEAYLLNLYQRRGGQIVKASPTFKPQTVNSILRLCDRLENPCNSGEYRRRAGYMVQLGMARALFFSAGPKANVVGATADLLLEADEAQDIGEDKWHKDFGPMAASTNATTVLYGTAWTADTLLARTIQHLRRQERADGVRRTFAYDADQIAVHVPAYGQYVQQQVARLGRDHPLIRTQYYLEAVDAQAGLFPPARRALMRGDHPRRHEPVDGKRYALLLDVAGEEEGAGALQLSFFANPRRDATALTVVEVEARPGALPLYRTVDRRLWLGVRHTALHDQILALASHWRAAWVVVDATGIGAGLASFLTKALPGRVTPVVFSSRVKSKLGWEMVGAVETGRYKDYVDDGQADTGQFWYEVEHCEYEILPGLGERMRWGVWGSPAGSGPEPALSHPRTCPRDGSIAPGRDDLLVSAALCTVLDDQLWPGTGSAELVQSPDPLDEIDRAAW